MLFTCVATRLLQGISTAFCSQGPLHKSDVFASTASLEEPALLSSQTQKTSTQAVQADSLTASSRSQNASTIAAEYTWVGTLNSQKLREAAAFSLQHCTLEAALCTYMWWNRDAAVMVDADYNVCHIVSTVV